MSKPIKVASLSGTRSTLSKPVITTPSGVSEEIRIDDSNIWSTAKAEAYIKGSLDGTTNTKRNPFYNGIKSLKGGNLIWEYTQEEVDEFTRCAIDIIYFAEKYVKLKTEDGYQHIVLRDYQKKILSTYSKERFVITLAARQAAKTTTTSIFMVWSLLFNKEYNIFLLGNKSDTTKELIYKVKSIIELLPWFLKPGVIKYDVNSLTFDNGCRLVGQTTTENSAIGFTIDLLYCDEFARVDSAIVDEFWENVYPTISASSKSKAFITSTANGRNLFSRIYNDAVSGLNDFVPIRIDWWEVPGRDAAWAEREIANLGSRDAFEVQYGNSFSIGNNVLLPPTLLDSLYKNRRTFLPMPDIDYDSQYVVGIDAISEMEKGLKWDIDYLGTDPSILKDKCIFLSIDISEGIGGDFSVIQIFELLKYTEPTEQSLELDEFSHFGLRQIGIFSSNSISIEDLSEVVYFLAVYLLDQDKLKILFESNSFGGYFFKSCLSIGGDKNELDDYIFVKTKVETSNLDKNNFKEGKLVRDYGLRLNSSNKIIYCRLLNQYIKKGRMIVYEEATITELSNFGIKDGGSSYEALDGHDDKVMSLVDATYFFETDYFTDLCEVLDTPKEDDSIADYSFLYN